MTLDNLDTLNDADPDEFVQAAGFLVENSPWVLRRVADARPFADVGALCDEIERVLRDLPRDAQNALMNVHPELAGAEAKAGRMNADSTSEQARLGLLSLDQATYAQLTSLNQAYREKFAFPCIVALRAQPDLGAVLDLFAMRLKSDVATEIDRNLTQIGLVVRARADRIRPGTDRSHIPEIKNQ